MHLRTRRFLLRDFVPEDLPAFVAYQTDPRSTAFYGEHAAGPSQAEALFRLFGDWAAATPRVNYQLAVVGGDEPRALLGCCGLRTEGCAPGEADFGIELASAYWGRYAYATEAAQAMIGFGFATLGLAAVRGSTVSANTRIARLATAFGATVTGTSTPAWMEAKGWTELKWRVTRTQWDRRTRALRRAAAPPPRAQPQPPPT